VPIYMNFNNIRETSLGTLQRRLGRSWKTWPRQRLIFDKLISPGFVPGALRRKGRSVAAGKRGDYPTIETPVTSAQVIDAPLRSSNDCPRRGLWQPELATSQGKDAGPGHPDKQLHRERRPSFGN
jgi:hypothetical protein